MTRHHLAKFLWAAPLALATACSSAEDVPSEAVGGAPPSGSPADGGRSGGDSGGQAAGGHLTAGQTNGGGAGRGDVSEPSGGYAGSGGAGGTGGAGGAGGTAGEATSGMGGAAASGASGGGAGGMRAYSPCPSNGTPCKILPLGDSITRGAKSSNDAGYRSQLFKLIVAANQKVTFTGSLTNGPTQESGQPFPRMHEGHSGWTISQLSPLIPSPGLDGKPNIVLLHIGTNDIASRDPTGMAKRLDALLDKITQQAPDALIVVAQITPARTDNDIRDAYNAKIPGIVQSRAAKGEHVISVNMNKLPMTGLNSDGVHPNDQGYAYMAGIWYAAIKDVLPK